METFSSEVLANMIGLQQSRANQMPFDTVFLSTKFKNVRKQCWLRSTLYGVLRESVFPGKIMGVVKLNSCEKPERKKRKM